MKKKILEFKNLSISFQEGKKIVKNLSFSLYEKETLALVGESGSGKSITALASMKLLPNNAKIDGSIFFENNNLLLQEEKELQKIRGNKVSYIFQEPMTSLNPLQTIQKQIKESLILHQKLSQNEASEKVVWLLEMVGLSKINNEIPSYPHQLSGGQRQRSMIAMALCNNPKILIADEPTTSLDLSVENKILNLLEDLKRQIGMSILFITHDLNVVKQIADNVVVMQSGKIVEKGTTENILNNPKMDYTRKLISEPEKIYKKKNYNNTPVIEVRNVSVNYPIRTSIFKRTKKNYLAVNNVSFKIAAGETLGIVGESGSGKSTLGKSIMRLVKPTSGKIKIRGKEITSLSKKEMFPIRKEVQIVFQDPYSSLNPRFTVGKIVSEGMSLHNICKDTEIHNKLIETFEKVGLREFHINNYPHEFSGGQRQRIGLARALALNPSLIIADEPVSALDVSVQAQVINLFMDLQEEFELSYMFIAHDLSVIAQICSKIGVMYLGNIVELTDRETLFKNPQHPYTKALLASIPLPNPQSKKKQYQLIKGDIPSPTNPPSGCKFHTRCPFSKKICIEEIPHLKKIDKDHHVSCHLI